MQSLGLKHTHSHTLAQPFAFSEDLPQGMMGISRGNTHTRHKNYFNNIQMIIQFNMRKRSGDDQITDPYTGY